MDDPLKPKAVPLAAETILWFEFLLDPELITKHLNKSNPEPSALVLMTQFISMTPDTIAPTQFPLTPAAELCPTGNLTGALPPSPSPSPLPQPQPQPPTTTAITTTPNVTTPPAIVPLEALHLTHKQMALKILALKVATWLKWNLDVLEKNLPIPKQLFLLRDLCTISFGKKVCIPLTPNFQDKISSAGNEKAARFALTFYHRWVLRLQILKDIATKAARPLGMGNIMVPMDPMHQFYAPDILPQNSVDYLQQLFKSNEAFYIFTYDTFVPLNPNNEEIGLTIQRFDLMLAISMAELRTQIFYDLVNFYLYTKQYQLAKEAVIECRHNLNLTLAEYEKTGRTSMQFAFCHVNEMELEGFLMACGVSCQTPTLLERFNMSSLTQYKDITEILKLDNRQREISLVNRRILEFDIEGGISQGILKEPRHWEMQVAALNVVRGICEDGNIFANIDYFDKYINVSDCFKIVLEYILDVRPYVNQIEWQSLKQYLIEAVVKYQDQTWIFELKANDILTQDEFNELRQRLEEDELPIPTLAALNEWKFNSNLVRIEIGSLERQLISCSNANTVRKLLVKLASTNPSKPLWTVNPSWEIATPIKSLLMSLQRGFLQDFAYVLLGKARELTAKRDYVAAVSLLSVLKSETQRSDMSATSIISKLGKLVTWEILLIQITQCLDEWNRKTLDLQLLGNRCKQCLNSLQSNDNIIPRVEIVENCAILLLNLNDWNSLIYLDKRLPQLELPLAFATTFLDMEKMKGPKKICRDAWDLILSMFLNNPKRNTNTIVGGVAGVAGVGGVAGVAGVGGSVNLGNASGSVTSPCLMVSTGLIPFLKRFRHPTIFSLAISILGKIHNLLKDDINHDLNGEYMQLWPTTLVSPQSSYNLRLVSETLHWLLTEALKYYPQNIAWLKMKGDLEMANGNNEAAMRCYVNALITGTEYCIIPLQRNVADDYIIRKMIRCSSNLGCHMQATVLCQFLEDIDYGIVFKNLAEKSANFTDAMDAYYNCIWDTTLLEFIINLHAKKGEHSRKLEAIAIMGTLELNANNSDEIKREAIAVRKARFLRALAKQYLL